MLTQRAQTLSKLALWEQSALVPFIIHDPARPEARVVSDPVALLDVGPTILDCLDLPPLEQTAGRSLRQVVEGGPADPERAVPTFNPIGSAIRKGPYRFIAREYMIIIYESDPGAIRGMCNDYRAAIDVDFHHDARDLDRKVHCPALVLYGADGAMAKAFDVAATWAPHLQDMTARNVSQSDANDGQPMWHGGDLYFLSDRDANKRNNIWLLEAGAAAPRQLTTLTDFDVRFPAIGPDAIVFEAGGRLYLLDLATEATTEVPVQVVTDRSTLKPRIESVGPRWLPSAVWL